MCPKRTSLALRPGALLLALALAAPARAQFFAAPPSTSLLIDTSIRSAAMGGAGAAVMWGEPGVWANPAALAGVRGMGFVTGHTHIIPGVDDNQVFSSQRLLIGGGGIGFSLMGQPISGLGKAKIDYGPVSFPPLNTELYSPYDLSEGWGVGGSPLKLAESFTRLGKHPRRFTSYGDVTFGYQSKDSKAFIDPSFTLPEASTYDWGVAGRLALARWWGEDAPFRLDLSGAYSQLNALASENPNPAASTIQIDRTAFALRLSPAPPSQRASSPPSLPWWRPGDIPTLAMGLAYDHDQRHIEPGGSLEAGSDHYGFEATVLRLLALRVGYVSDPDNPSGGIEGMTYGGGVTLPIGPWGSVGYQLASTPPFTAGTDRLFRQGWSLWLDPSRIWEDAR